LSDEGDAVEKFMKVPYDETPECHGIYDEACPSKLLPVEVPTIIAIGTSDTDIPLDMVEDFYWYAKKIGGEVATRAAPAAMAFSTDSGDAPITYLSQTQADAAEPAEESVREGSDTADGNASTLSECRISEAAPTNSGDKTKQSRQSLSSCAVPVPIKLVKLPGADHYDVVNAKTTAWGRIFDEMNNITPSLSDIPQLESFDGDIDKVALMLLTSGPQATERNSSGVLAPASLQSAGGDVSSPSTPIRCAPSRWASDMSDEPLGSKDTSAPYDSGSSESDDDDDGDQDEVIDMKSVASESEPCRALQNSREDDNGESAVGAERENPDAEIFFFPTPKSDRTRRNHSFSFRFGR
jgi:hypothetical protein